MLGAFLSVNRLSVNAFLQLTTINRLEFRDLGKKIFEKQNLFQIAQNLFTAPKESLNSNLKINRQSVRKRICKPTIKRRKCA